MDSDDVGVLDVLQLSIHNFALLIIFGDPLDSPVPFLAISEVVGILESSVGKLLDKFILAWPQSLYYLSNH